jgi:hypothetical protein
VGAIFASEHESATFPLAQVWQNDLPSALVYLPPGQAVHSVRPETDWNLPLSHGVHSSDFVAAAYVPRWQESHMLLPSALAFVPSAQSLQFSAPPRAYWPLAQFSQTVAVVLVLCWPAMHSVHSQAMLSVLLNFPVGQADLFSGHVEQTLLPMAAKEP